jgi:2-(1,2-epoxy-1,2-dihydrophenyl)acetyl-CoA isomerase
MATDHLLESAEDGVVTLTLNRPEVLNAMSRSMIEQLIAALRRFATDDAVGCVVLTGAGRGFCSGGDVRAMAERADQAPPTLESRTNDLRERMEASRLLHESPKPTIAMINGPVAGAGLSLALACDMRFMAQGARLSTAFANVGYSGDFGGSYFLTHLVGTAKARELYFLAERVDADEALRLGIVNRVYPEASLREETMKVAKRIAAGPRIAYRYMKRNFNAAESASLKEAFDIEAWGHSRTGETEDHKEASKAFVEKRAPVFKGR